jgi:hypothetical protein
MHAIKACGHKMEPSGKLHATAILPKEIPQIHFGQEFVWVLESTWRLWEENTFLFYQELKKKFFRPSCLFIIRAEVLSPPPPHTHTHKHEATALSGPGPHY